ncbi:DUF3857 domain-containing protein [bacterium]|nr:DUF3857 domain-containing protein [candidate division CSSED10-310 bacterium]
MNRAMIITMLCIIGLTFVTAAEQPHARILSDRHEYILAGDTVTHRLARRVQVFDENGLDEFADATFLYDSEKETMTVRRAETVLPDGRHMPSPDTAINRTLPWQFSTAPDFAHFRTLTVSFIGIVPGSVLEYELEHTAPTDSLFSRTVVLAEATAVDSIDVLVTVPDDQVLTWELLNIEGELEITSRKGSQTYGWHFETIEPIIYEPPMDHYGEYPPRLRFSTIESWESLVEELNGRVYPAMAELPQAEEKARLLVKDCAGPAAALDAVCAYIDEAFTTVRISPPESRFSSRAPARIWETMYGHPIERVILLGAMIRELGGDAELQMAGPLATAPEQAVGVEGFPELLLAVTLRGEHRLLSITDKLQPRDMASMDGRISLRIPRLVPAPGELLLRRPMPAADAATRRLELTMTVAEDGSVKGGAYVAMTGGAAPYLKMRKNTDAFVKTLAGTMAEKVELDAMDILDLTPAGCALSFSFKGTLPFKELAGGARIWQPPDTGAWDEFVPKPRPGKRINEFTLERPFVEKVHITVDHPASWQLLKHPEPLVMERDFATLSTTFEQKEGSFIITRDLRMHSDIISPILYPAFFSLYEMVTKDHCTNVIIKPGEADEKDTHEKQD